MTKQKSIQGYVTREILKEEISASEKRLLAIIDTRFETSSQSLRDYTDSRFTQLDTKIDGVEKRLGAKIEDLGAKMDRYFEGIVKMVEGFIGKVTDGEDRWKDHEMRITFLEGRGPQPGRI